VNLDNIKMEALFIQRIRRVEYRSYIIKYFVNCCETEGIIIYSLIRFNDMLGRVEGR
jgi:hypothetical protein